MPPLTEAIVVHPIAPTVDHTVNTRTDHVPLVLGSLSALANGLDGRIMTGSWNIMTYILPSKHAVVRLMANFDFMCRDKNIYFLYNYLFAVNVPVRLRYIRYSRKSRHPGFAVHIGWFVLHSSALSYFVKARVLSIGAD